MHSLSDLIIIEFHATIIYSYLYNYILSEFEKLNRFTTNNIPCHFHKLLLSRVKVSLNCM